MLCGFNQVIATVLPLLTFYNTTSMDSSSIHLSHSFPNPPKESSPLATYNIDTYASLLHISLDKI
jgi:hypothetical protein